jgi:predicted transposase YbfD/YdcC
VRFSQRHHSEICALLKIKQFLRPPSYEVFENAFSKLETNCFEEAFNRFFNKQQCKLLHLDGKASAGTITNPNTSQQAFLVTVSAYSSELKETIMRKSFNSKASSECEVARSLIAELNKQRINKKGIEQKVITGDSAHCNQETTSLFHKHEYLFQFKGNQKKLKEDALVLEESRKPDSEHYSVEYNRDRVEKRLTKVYRYSSSRWENARSIIIQERQRNGKCEKAFYLSNKLREASERALQIRSHWSVESMHWEKDELMGEDRSRIRNMNLAGTMSCLRTIGLNISKRAGYYSFTVFRDSFSQSVERLFSFF